MQYVSYTTEGAVGIIELNRPPVNALSAEVAANLYEALEQASEPDIRAVVMTGRPHFAAGADISAFQAAHRSDDEGVRSEEASRLTAVIRQMELMAQPIIAAVFGYALGGGLELAMGADFRYLAEDARVGQPESRLGIIPGAGGTQRLTRLVGFNRGREIIYSGRHLEAQEALAIGLADKVFPAKDLLDAALADAAAYAKGPSVALGMAKRAINEGWGRPIEEGIAIEADAFDISFRSDDAKEGVAAFLEKRKPDFKGS
ncbi:MAG: enoyl-CoA hydratase/isomerase family protein [Acidimicrobiia bacterium]|nr:enoyl-CoA hydratase/isomerase family protein [Acidimicrobiia bacterium]